MTYNFQDIRTLQVDITSYCNSFCGTCARNESGGETISKLKLNHLSLESWNNLITTENLTYIDNIVFNGNFGDFGMHPDAISFIDRIYEIKPTVSVHIHTNGGPRTEKFWLTLGQRLSKFKYHSLTFSIDGVESNAHRYRRGTEFDKIIKNARAAISGGANCVWRYIVFDHNIDDIPLARQLAIDVGFSEFRLNRSNKEKIDIKAYKSFPADTITAPNPQKVNELFDTYHYARKDFLKFKSNHDDPLDSPCPWERDTRIQVDYLGNLWPCCYISMIPVKVLESEDRDTSINEIIAKYGNFNDTGVFSLEQILSHKFFKLILPTIWETQQFTVCNKCLGNTTIKK